MKPSEVGVVQVRIGDAERETLLDRIALVDGPDLERVRGSGLEGQSRRHAVVVQRTFRVRDDGRIVGRAVVGVAIVSREDGRVEDGRRGQDGLPAEIGVPVVRLDLVVRAGRLLRERVRNVPLAPADEPRNAQSARRVGVREVEAQERSLRVAVVVEVVEVRGIEETVRLGSVDREVIAEARRAAAGRSARVVGLEPGGTRSEPPLRARPAPRPDFVVRLITAAIFSPYSAGTFP